MSEKRDIWSRRRFLQGACISSVGAGALGAFGCFSGRTSERKNEAAPSFPYKYVSLDKEKAMQRAYQGYLKGGWGFGTAEGLFGSLAEVVGTPYTMIPPLMFKSFRTGIEKWGATCGAVIPPIAFIGCIVADEKVRVAMVNELMAWYTQYPFPQYQPAGLNLERVVVGSPLCHISVTTWANVQGVDVGSREKKERCAGVSADVVGKTIEMLDVYVSTGQFVGTCKPDPVVDTCMGCHEESAPYTLGKDNCLRCHGSILTDVENDENHKGLIP